MKQGQQHLYNSTIFSSLGLLAGHCILSPISFRARKKHGNKSFCLSVLALAGTLCDKSSWKGSGFPTLTCKATGAWRWGRWATNEECSPLWFTKSIYLTMTLRERITDGSIPCSDWCPYVFKLDAVHFAGHMCPITMEECSPLLQFLFQFRVLAMLWRQSCEHVPLWRKIWFSCQSLVPHSKHGNKSFCLLALAAARTLGDNGQLAPKCYTSGNIKQHLVDKHLMHFRSYSLTAGRARKTSNCRTWYAFELRYSGLQNITVALALALAKRINGLNTPKNSAFHPCQHGFLVILVSPSVVTSGKISNLDWEFQQPMNSALWIFQFLTDKTWWKNVKGPWGLAGVKAHVFTILKVWQISFATQVLQSALCVCVCVEKPVQMFKEKAITNKFTGVMLSQSVLLACKSSMFLMFLPSKTFGISWPTISLRLEKSESHPERWLSFSNVPPQTCHPSPTTALVKLVKIRVLFQPRRQKQVDSVDIPSAPSRRQGGLEAPHAPCSMHYCGIERGPHSTESSLESSTIPPACSRSLLNCLASTEGGKLGNAKPAARAIAAKGYLARVFDALAWMFVNLHAKLQAVKIAHGGTTSNPSVSRCWLLQGHYVIMDSLHQNATHLGTSKQHLVDHAFDDAFQVLQSYCWRAKKNMYFCLYIWARLLPHTAYHWGTSTCISEAHQRFEHC